MNADHVHFSGSFVTVKHGAQPPSQLVAILDGMNADPEIKARLLAEEHLRGQRMRDVDTRFCLDSGFRDYLRKRFEKEPLPDGFERLANMLGFNHWDAIGFQRAPASLPDLADLEGFEAFMTRWNAEWEETGIPAEQRRVKQEKERQELANVTAAYNQLCKLVPQALKKARSASKLSFYGPFEKSLKGLAGYRYYIGALLAKEDHNPLTDLPLEVGIGISAAKRFQQENQRWPKFPFAIDRMAARLVETR